MRPALFVQHEREIEPTREPVRAAFRGEHERRHVPRQQHPGLLCVRVQQLHNAADVALDDLWMRKDLGRLSVDTAARRAFRLTSIASSSLSCATNASEKTTAARDTVTFLIRPYTPLDLPFQAPDLTGIDAIQLVEVPGERLYEPRREVRRGELPPQRLDHGGRDLPLRDGTSGVLDFRIVGPDCTEAG